MGGNASKMGRSGSRVLQTKGTPRSYPQTNQIPSTRPSRSHNKLDTENSNPVDTVADRLRCISPVKEIEDLRNYKPASEDEFTMTLAARQRLDDALAQAQERGDLGTPRRQIPASTISAMVKSIGENEPIERILKMYNVDRSVLKLLRTVSIPQPPARSLPNELLHDNTGDAHRQPVRRKRNTA